MTGRFSPKLATLPASQQQLWPVLSPAKDLGFVLYGGTAVALRFGHRLSVDFDFFSESALDRAAIQSAFGFMASSTVLQDERNMLSVLVKPDPASDSHVKVSFFGALAFGRVGAPDLTDDGVLLVASTDDLMATKVKVVLQRAEAKDYRDIAELLRGGAGLSRGLGAARKLFGPNFQPSESLKALVYFEDGDLRTLSADDRRTLVTAVSAVRELPEVELAASTLR
jgi:Nucleotidyl transferase AbiEii toxin, Type IV TA system